MPIMYSVGSTPPRQVLYMACSFSTLQGCSEDFVHERSSLSGKNNVWRKKTESTVKRSQESFRDFQSNFNWGKDPLSEALAF